MWWTVQSGAGRGPWSRAVCWSVVCSSVVSERELYQGGLFEGGGGGRSYVFKDHTIKRNSDNDFYP